MLSQGTEVIIVVSSVVPYEIWHSHCIRQSQESLREIYWGLRAFCTGEALSPETLFESKIALAHMASLVSGCGPEASRNLEEVPAMLFTLG